MNRIAKFSHKVLYDNKILMIFSVAVAVIIWLVVAISLSPTDEVTIKDVPVVIDLNNSIPAQYDLEIFGQSEFTVDVEVSGKRYIVNSKSVNANSIKVVAQTAYVDSAGKHSLQLKASKVNANDEFEIISVSQEFIEAYFDVYQEQEFPVEAKLDIKDELVEEGYVAGDAILSAEKVTVSGPATEVGRISKVYATLTVDKPLDQSKTEAAKLTAHSDSGATLNYLTYNYGNSEITVTLPVYYVVTKPTAVQFKNTPIDYIDKPFKYTVSPANFTAGIQGVDETTAPSALNIATIDFAELKPGKNTFTFKSDDIPAVFSIDGLTEFKVTVNVTGCEDKTLTLPQKNISFINAPEGYEVKRLSKTIESVKVVGPAESLAKISASDITAVIDLTDADLSSNSQGFAAKLSIKGTTDCWVSGTYSVTAVS